MLLYQYFNFLKYLFDFSAYFINCILLIFKCFLYLPFFISRGNSNYFIFILLDFLINGRYLINLQCYLIAKLCKFWNLFILNFYIIIPLYKNIILSCHLKVTIYLFIFILLLEAHSINRPFLFCLLIYFVYILIFKIILYIIIVVIWF